MNEDLKKITNLLNSAKCLSDADKAELASAIKSIDKKHAVTSFKLDRTEKVKRTTSILLEETIEELELKRKAIEKQAHQAKIEATLEKVRLQAMAMDTSDDLSQAVATVFDGLDELGFKTIRCGIGIFNDQSRKVNVWTISPDDQGDKTLSLSGDEILEGHPLLEGIFESWRNRSDYSYKLSGKNLINYYDVVSDSNLPVRAPADINEEQVQHYHCVMFPAGGLFAFSDSEFTEEAKVLMKRFGDVFHLAFTRHLDLKLAEAQARESKIEVALERVRTQSMLMQHSDELSKTSIVFHEQLQLLGVNSEFSYLWLPDDEKSEHLFWATWQDELKNSLSYKNKQVIYPLDKTEPSIAACYQAWESGESVHINPVTPSEVKNYFDTWKELLYGIEKFNPKYFLEGLYYVDSYMKYGCFGIVTRKMIDEDDKQILSRFTTEFERAYTRFLDLQKAEAQARESEIELALERIRARTMAMQQSTELSEVVAVLYEQMDPLGFATSGCEVIFCNEKSDEMEYWFSDPMQSVLPESFNVPRHGHPILLEQWKAWKQRDTKKITELSGKKKREFDLFLFEKSDFKKLPDLIKKEILKEDKVVFSHVSWKYGLFGAIDTHPLSNQKLAILKRFASVFEQTYIRFFDLQKAEAQAREAKVEAALERVRSLALGMRKSEEVGNVTDRLFTELISLSVDVNGGSIVVIDEDVDKMELWRARSNIAVKPFESTSFTESMDLLKKYMPDWFPKFIKALGTRKNHLIDELSAERREQYINVIAEQYKYSDEEKKQLLKNAPKNITTYYIYFKLGYLVLLGEKKLSAGNLSITRRFVEVFEFSYTRYLDIQKAEVQAKEAKIQLALEKVRMVALGLHKSIEMLEVARALYEQLIELGFTNIRNAIIDINNGDDDTFTDYDYSHEMSGTITQMSYHDDPTLEGQFKKMATTTDDFFELVLDRKELEGLEAMRIKNGEDQDPRLLNTDLLTYNLYSFGNGAIGISNFGILSEEEKSILSRFSNVFTFAYKRYNDLAKAEAQAREALIEAALERVRAKTMAMQKSNELAQTAAHLFSQLNELGIKPYRCNIAIVDKELKKCRIWSTTNSGNVIPTGSALPLDEYPVLQEMYDGWRTLKPNHIIKLVGTARLEWTKYISTHLPFEEYKKNKINEDELLKEAAFLSNLYFKQGFFTVHSKEELNEDQLKIIQRFAYVFEQTYTRFLDLENAEKQNKIIQAENERKTEELEEARQLQLAMLPKDLPQLPNLDIAVYMQTATEVGGDYYDFHVADDGTLTTVIGDATGHGMKAGTIVTITKSLFNSLASEPNILETFKKVSQVIKDMKFKQLSMCLMMMKINGNLLSLSSAAMPPAYIYRKREKKIEEIVLNGMPLGALVNFPYKIKELTISSGDTILLMSDGYPELMNEKKEMFSYERAIQLFEDLADRSSNEIIIGLKNSASEWTQDKMPDDDVTFVVIKVK